MRIAVLALQGDFAEHESVFKRMNIPTCQLRKKQDLSMEFDALIRPGGESTVQGKLLHELEMFDPLRERIREGLPVFATCAGLILLAERLMDDPTVHFGTLNAVVRRNAYGRQLGSFFHSGTFAGMENIPMSFIRAPQIEFCSPACQVLAEHGGRITALRQGNQLAMTFHPELETDCRAAAWFLREIVSPCKGL